MSSAERRDAEDDVLAAALTLLAATSPRAIKRTDAVGDRIVVSRAALLRLRDAYETAWPGSIKCARALLITKGATGE